LFYSFDGGTNFSTLAIGDSIIWKVKGDRKQIKIKGSAAGVVYEAIINFEEF